MTDQSSIFLVSCVRRKLPTPAPARELYVSTWFKFARDHVEQTGHKWFILSALHGLVRPEDVVAPYEKTLNKMSRSERATWAESVLNQLAPFMDRGSRIVIF